MTSEVSPLLSLQQQLQHKCSPFDPNQSSTLPLASKALKRRSWSLSSEASSFSLPFKKRRFVLIPVSDEEEEDRLVSTPFCLESIHVPPLGTKEEPSQSQPRERLVATPTLGMVEPVGSATVPSSMVAEGIACITPVPNALHKAGKALLFPKQVSQPPPQDKKEHTNDKDENKATSLSAPAPMQTRWSRRHSSSSSNANNSAIDTAVSALVSLPRKRPSHPKLNVPLPNGCHGQTSRTQSFCRRGPNYKGSNYCKLHYFDPRYNNNNKAMIDVAAQQEQEQEQQDNDETVASQTIACPQVPESSSNNSNSDATSTVVMDHEKPFMAEPKSLDGTESMAFKTSKSGAKHKRAPRDKLYRGNSATANSNSQDESVAVEVRCLAISTRGKRCCYAAVACNGNEYCHRHSSFFFAGSNDKGSKNSNKKAKPKRDSRDKSSTSTTPRMESSSSSSKTCSSSRRNRSSVTSHKAALAATAMASENNLPRPPSALSDLSTDLWQNRRVVISKGPHESKIGTVVRWRNGWVTVELNQENQVYHNRRSYELFLV